MDLFNYEHIKKKYTNNSFKPTYNEILFVLLSLIIPLAFVMFSASNLGYEISKTYGKILETSVYVFFFVYFLIIAYIYKKKTDCSEFSLFKAIFYFNLILAIFSLVLAIILFGKYTENITLFIFSKLFSTISSIVLQIIIALGIANIFFQKKINFKEMGVIILFSFIINILSSYEILQTIISYISSRGINSTTYFSISPHITIISLVGLISFSFLYYGYKKLEEDFIKPNSEILFFSIVGVVVFILEYANGLFGVSFAGDFELFLINFQFLVKYIMFGIFFRLYRKYIKPKIGHTK